MFNVICLETRASSFNNNNDIKDILLPIIKVIKIPSM